MTQTVSCTSHDATRAASRFARVMPLAFISYGLAYLDRVNYGSADARGLSHDLGMKPWMGPVLSATFFLGYAVFQIPAASYVRRRSVKWLIFWALVFWGALSGLTGVIRNIPLLFVDRVLLGMVEGVVLPAMLVHLTHWFVKRERSRANAVLLLTNPAVMAITMTCCGFIIDYFDRHPMGHFSGWQMMFIVEGLPSIVWAFIWLWLVDEKPSDASWLSADEVAAFQTALDSEQREIKQVSDYRTAFADTRVILLSLMFACFCGAGYGLMMWLPGIVSEGTKQRPAIAGLFSAIPYVIAVFSMLAVSWASDRTLRRKPYVFGSMLIGSAAFIASYVAGPHHFLIAFLGLTVAGSCIYTPTAPLWAWMAEILPRNVAGESMALVNSAGSFGSFFGVAGVGLLKTYFQSNGAAFIFQASLLAAATLLGAAAAAVRPKEKPLAAGFPLVARA